MINSVVIDVFYVLIDDDFLDGYLRGGSVCFRFFDLTHKSIGENH